MNNLLKENVRIFSIILALLFVLLIVVYFVFVSPASKQLKAAKQNVSSLETDISLLESNRNQSTSNVDFDTLMLEKKVPLTPELETLLLTFQEIELVSGSRIENIEFNYDGELPDNNIAAEEENEDGATEENESSDAANDNSDAPPPQAANGNQPEFLRKITAKIDVKSPDYDSFQDFLTEIEKSERITRVDKLTFEKPAERELLEGSKETITFTIEVTTFYYEE